MNALRTSAVIAALVLVAALRPVAAQSPSIQAEMLKDWTDLKATMDKIANEMPDDKFGFKSTPAQQTFGERVLHVAQVNAGLLRLLGGKAAAPTIRSSSSRAA